MANVLPQSDALHIALDVARALEARGIAYVRVKRWDELVAEHGEPPRPI